MAEQHASLEHRLRAIEDRLAIYNLIAGHPPSADTGAAAYAEAVYSEDGVFDRGADLPGWSGNKGIAANLKSAGHQAAIAGGLAHFTGLPHVTVNGDKAVVISYLQILAPKKSGEAIEVPNHGASRGYHSTAWSPIAGTSSAPRPAGRSNGAHRGWSTVRSRRGTSCAEHSRRIRPSRAKRGVTTSPVRPRT